MIAEMIGRSCRRRGLTAAKQEEFAAFARTYLVENDHAIRRSYRRQSTIEFYLAVVIERLLIDFFAQKRRQRP
jgi:hypothetical protein